MVKLPAARSVVALATTPDAQDEVVARLFTSTVWLATVAPEAAEAVTMLEFDEVTVRADRGPVKLLSAWTSLSRLVVSVCSCVSALVWLLSVASWFCQSVSGCWAAVTAAFTAEVTSMPEEEAPVAACRIELRSIPEVEDDEVEAKSEFNADVELMSMSCP
jgi:hypothetical protein